MKTVILLAVIILASGCTHYDPPCFEPRSEQYLSPDCMSQRMKKADEMAFWEFMLNRSAAYPPQGGTGTGQSQIHIPDAYGPGLHSDQYGRPVTVEPR